MIVGRRSISLQGSRPPSHVGVSRVACRRPITSRAHHQSSHPPQDASPLDRVERHFDDRDRMYPAADLLRLVGRHKQDPGNKHLLPWMLRVETALEFMTDLDNEAADAQTEQERHAATCAALKNAQGIRQLLDAFDPFLADAPEIFEDTLQAADAAFHKRIDELARTSRQFRHPAPPRQPRTEGLLAGFAQLWSRLNEEVERNVERREGPPASSYHPLDFFKKHTDDRR